MLSPAAKRHFKIFRDPFQDDVNSPDDVYLSDEQRYILEAMLQTAKAGGIITAVYYCPYLEGAPVKAYDKKSDWRKPAPGMVLQAAKDYDIDLKQSFMIGDMPRDVECGQRAGMDGYLFTGGRLDDFVRAIVAERKGRESI